MRELSVVLATFNEESNLAGCLDSIRGLADEIIVVDGTSTDKTVEIAKKYNAKVVITENKKNFHINKQMAIDLATKDWILQLDADERVSPELSAEITGKIKNSKLEIKNSVNGYWMPRKNFFLGRFLMKGGQYPDYTLRLYENGKGHLPKKDVHEQAEVIGKVGYLKSALLHYPYKNFSMYLKKWSRYNDFFAVQINEQLKARNFLVKIFYAVVYLLVKPAHWFLTTYFRHKGFMDSWQGFVFSLFSALRFPVSYIKYLSS
jgi:glycosyltransferase involved in cell wall biosynthesis